MNKIMPWVVVIFILILAGSLFWNKKTDEKVVEEVYLPVINPSDFGTNIDNPYFTLRPGMKFVFEAIKVEGKERIEVTVLPETKMIMGVETVVVKDQVFINDSLIEDTLDWYAQDNVGNVWYFGEETAEYENGQITTTAGSWEGGMNGAMPGIVMKSDPRVGDKYRQEYYRGEAEDMAEVLSINESLTVPYGSFTDCIKTFDYTPLDPKSLEHKYYCKGSGFVTLEINLEDNERTELVSKKTDALSQLKTPILPTTGATE